MFRTVFRRFNSTRALSTSIDGAELKWGLSHESHLPRSLIKLSGKGVQKYLQGLVTVDIDRIMDDLDTSLALESSRVLESGKENVIPEGGGVRRLHHCYFLDIRGRIITDGMLWLLSRSSVILDLPNFPPPKPSSTSSSSPPHHPLYPHLKTYNIRGPRHLKITPLPTHYVSCIYGLPSHVLPPPPGSESGGVVVGDHDVRGEGMGMRVICDEECDFGEIINKDMLPEAKGTNEFLRYLQGLPEGAEVQGRSVVESCGDIMEGVHFDKGCYLGQEFTARSYFKGVVRKRVTPAVVYGGGEGGGEGIKGKLKAKDVAGYMWAEGRGEDYEGGGENVRDDGKTFTINKGDEIRNKEGKRIGKVVGAGETGKGVGGGEGGFLLLIECKFKEILNEDIGGEKGEEVRIGDAEGEWRIRIFEPEWWPEMDDMGKEVGGAASSGVGGEAEREEENDEEGEWEYVDDDEDIDDEDGEWEYVDDDEEDEDEEGDDEKDKGGNKKKTEPHPFFD
ncbi:hypothetical protein TrCOL_g13729 [Triparma columacea]|uniref:Aminomethyltransferase folate-binding domain-containing protein n=1 Tax=Triparma columacea TaxID=722753 RepID=A0A9W7G071_9STRA|nr:hypothetical protein TrCOL_g13729 [Triparma columacea]